LYEEEACSRSFKMTQKSSDIDKKEERRGHKERKSKKGRRGH